MPQQEKTYTDYTDILVRAATSALTYGFLRASRGARPEADKRMAENLGRLVFSPFSEPKGFKPENLARQHRDARTAIAVIITSLKEGKAIEGAVLESLRPILK